MKKDNGGPAFPHQRSEHDTIGGGISVRDWFAGKALSRVDRETWLAMCQDARSSGPRTPAQECAAHCYEIADAMLEERKK